MKQVTVSTKGEQDVTTPKDLIQRVNKIWPCFFDLAATKENARFPRFYTKEDNSLDPKTSWTRAQSYQPSKYLWLNPPFKKTGSFMERCLRESKKNGVKIVTLTLSSKATVWYRETVRGNALSLILVNRIKFEGHKDLYPKELMLNIFGMGIEGEGYWDWKSVRI